jgi:predicted transport protein
MKKIVLALLAGFLLVSCDDSIQYLNGTKIVFEGKLLDSNNLPAANIPIKVAYYKEGGGYGGIYGGNSSDYTEPGYGFSDENGNFKLFVSSAENESEIQLIINEEEVFDFQNKRILRINDTNIIAYKLNFNPIVLQKISAITKVKVTFNRITSPNAIIVKNVEFIGQTVSYETDFNPSENGDYSQNFDIIPSIYFDVLKNQNAIIQYDLVDKNSNLTLSTLTSTVQILNNNLEKIIEY